MTALPAGVGAMAGIVAASAIGNAPATPCDLEARYACRLTVSGGAFVNPTAASRKATPRPAELSKLPAVPLKDVATTATSGMA
jgi:hypothetical protein